MARAELSKKFGQRAIPAIINPWVLTASPDVCRWTSIGVKTKLILYVRVRIYNSTEQEKNYIEIFLAYTHFATEVRTFFFLLFFVLRIFKIRRNPYPYVRMNSSFLFHSFFLSLDLAMHTNQITHIQYYY